MNDDRPDPHLRAALRHAPDADLQAPAALGARIRAAARDAVEADRPLPWWRRLWPSTPLRLGASGAFASVLLAGVIGLLWRGEPPPAAVDPRPTLAEPAAPAPVPTTVPTTTPTTAPTTAPQTRPPATALPRPQPAPRTEAPAARAKAAVDATASAPTRERSESRVAESAGAADASATPAAEAPPTAMDNVDAAKAAAPSPTAAATTAMPAAPAAPTVTVDRARRLAAPVPHAARADGAAGSAPLPVAADAWRREWDRTVGERWRVLEGAPPIALRRIGAAEVGVAGNRVYLCEGLPRRCRDAELTADEAKRLAAVLPP